MKDPDCTQCQEWELCPFHPHEDDAVDTQRAVDAVEEHWAGFDAFVDVVSGADVSPGRAVWQCVPCGAVYPDSHLGPCDCTPLSRAVDPSWRKLGLDDPEVSTDMIYAVPGGGVVGVPQP